MNHAITNLRTLPLALSYQSGTHDLVRDFYLPCLGAAKLYQRAVGYFSSQGLALAAQGLQQLLEKGGRMQLIASPVLHEEDIQAIRAGYDQRSILEKAARRELDPANLPSDDLLRDRLRTLAWLIASGRLDVRLAVGAKGGLFHLKIGLFTDNDGNCVAFSGSANETHGLDFTAFAAELLKPYLGARQPPGAAGLEVHEPAAPYLAPHEQAAEGCRAPRNSHLWPHQVAAIAAWEANQRVGILEMCTGAGKTVTALEVVKRELLRGSSFQLEKLSSLELEARATSDFVLIVCPTKILVEQWAS